MGRRRSRRKPPPKNKLVEPLPTNFACPFCNHEKSCEGNQICKMKIFTKHNWEGFLEIIILTEGNLAGRSYEIFLNIIWGHLWVIFFTFKYARNFPAFLRAFVE